MIPTKIPREDLESNLRSIGEKYTESKSCNTMQSSLEEIKEIAKELEMMTDTAYINKGTLANLLLTRGVMD